MRIKMGMTPGGVDPGKASEAGLAVRSKIALILNLT
jgi:hypothetical protein